MHDEINNLGGQIFTLQRQLKELIARQRLNSVDQGDGDCSSIPLSEVRKEEAIDARFD